jgi:hypothetical protein
MDRLYAKLCPKLKEPKFATMSDIEALLAIQSEIVWIRVWVDTADAIWHATREGYYARMKHISESPPPEETSQAYICWAAAKNIIGFVESTKTQKIDMDSEGAVGMKMAMVGCGFATQAQVASLDALANKQVTWAESEGLPAIDLGHIVSAREINSNDTA